MSVWVLLRHELPDGSWHHDWLIEPPSGDGLSVAQGLISFRLTCEMDWPPKRPFTALRIGPHRREYLTYQGPVSGGRGRVERVAAGDCRIVDISDRGLVLALLPDPAVLLRGYAVAEPAAETPWRFDLESP